MYKKIVIGIFCLVSHVAFAQIVAVGTVNLVRTSDAALFGADPDLMLVDGFTSAGACATYGSYGGLVTLGIRDGAAGNRQIAIATAAKALGKKVRVSVDPAYTRNDGTCFLRWIEFAE
ncbi:MAG TPA: hypothetical protein VIF82_13565 [Burkholderiaceae bacterium]|jgi:hypothetical protein